MEIWDYVALYRAGVLRRRKLPVELYPHQQAAVDKLRNGNILWGGVGTGKSLTSLVYFYTKVCKGVIGDFGSLREPKDLYIITTAKKRDELDWDRDAAKLGIGRDREGSVAGIQMTVDSWNNIAKYEGVKGAFFIFDEQRVVGSGAWQSKFIKIAKSNEWILLSATPGDTWLDYIPVFVANGFYKNRTAFKRQHVVYNTYSKFPKVDRYIEVGTLVRNRNKILVHMPYKRHTIRKVKDVHVTYDKELFDKVVKKRWHVYEERPLRDVSELFSVMRKVVNSDSSRIEKIEQLLSTHKRLIVFYNFDYELETLRSLVPEDQLASPESIRDLKEKLDTQSKPRSSTSTRTSTKNEISLSPTISTRSSRTESESTTVLEEFEKKTSSSPMSPSTTFSVAEWNGHKHEPIPKTDRWVYLVQYVAGSEGWNCVETDAMCFYSLTYSYKNFAQAHGRIDRLNTPFRDLHYYILMSDSLIDKAVRKSLNEKRSFNESSLKI